MSKTLGITELIRRCGGDEAVMVQSLMTDMRGAQLIDKGQATEIRFGTRAVSATQIMLGTETKVGLVLWVDKAASVKALADFKREQSEQAELRARSEAI